MKKSIIFFLIGLFCTLLPSGCNKSNKGSARLEQFAKEINEAPDKQLTNGTLLTGCLYNVGDTLFTYIIKVNDNRYDNIEPDSIKAIFGKDLKSDGMRKIINHLNSVNVGLRYNLTLPEKEVSIEFPSSELKNSSSN